MQYNIDMNDSELPTNIEKIKEFEKLIDAILPKDYIDFLLEHNGGHPVKDTYDLIDPINGIDAVADIAWFYALYEGEVCNLYRNYQIFKHNKPSSLLPIAYASGGDSICLSITGPNQGKIYFWDVHDQAPEGEAPWYNNVYLIANHFQEFIDKLYETELDENNNLVRVDN